MGNFGETARGMFAEGYNCAQSVFLTFSDGLGIEKKTAARLANCLGGGMVGRGGLCGAVAGACIAVSAKHGRDVPSKEGEALARQQNNYALVKGLLADFEEQYGAVNCRDLLERGLAASGEARYEKHLCPAYVSLAAELAGAAIGDNT